MTCNIFSCATCFHYVSCKKIHLVIVLLRWCLGDKRVISKFLLIEPVDNTRWNVSENYNIYSRKAIHSTVVAVGKDLIVQYAALVWKNMYETIWIYNSFISSQHWNDTGHLNFLHGKSANLSSVASAFVGGGMARHLQMMLCRDVFCWVTLSFVQLHKCQWSKPECYW